MPPARRDSLLGRLAAALPAPDQPRPTAMLFDRAICELATHAAHLQLASWESLLELPARLLDAYPADQRDADGLPRDRARELVVFCEALAYRLLVRRSSKGIDSLIERLRGDPAGGRLQTLASALGALHAFTLAHPIAQEGPRDYLRQLEALQAHGGPFEGAVAQAIARFRHTTGHELSTSIVFALDIPRELASLVVPAYAARIWLNPAAAAPFESQRGLAAELVENARALDGRYTGLGGKVQIALEWYHALGLEQELRGYSGGIAQAVLFRAAQRGAALTGAACATGQCQLIGPMQLAPVDGIAEKLRGLSEMGGYTTLFVVAGQTIRRGSRDEALTEGERIEGIRIRLITRTEAEAQIDRLVELWSDAPAATPPPVARPTRTVPWAVAGVAACALVAASATWRPAPRRIDPPPPPTRTATPNPPDPPPSSLPGPLDELRRDAERGDPKAQYKLGEAYRWGRGVPRDAVEALSWLRKSAVAGYAVAQTDLGVMLLSNDPQEAGRWFVKAAEQGNTAAQYNVGISYERGNIFTKDAAEAVRWFRLAAAKGHAPSQYWLGIHLMDGTGVQRDLAEGARWLRLAAEAGDVSAMCALGLALVRGDGVTQDRVESTSWYRKAAERGNVNAQYIYALALELGTGVPRDPAEARVWLKRAAEQGHAEARRRLESLR